MIRLRQVALVAADRDAVIDELGGFLAVSVCAEDDPDLVEFGLRNAILTIGDQFLEVVSPTTSGTTAGRLLDKRGGDGGYMAIFEVNDLQRRSATLEGLGVRTVFKVELPDMRAHHLHPRDVGGAIVSIEQPNPYGTWRWAGVWSPHAETSVATGIAGIEVAAADPVALAARWAELGLDHAVRFVPATPRGEGIDGIDLVATNRSRVGQTVTIGGVALRLV
jgi:Glyoxalase-like domain